MTNELEKSKVLILLHDGASERYGPFCRASMSMAQVEIIQASTAIDPQHLENVEFVFSDVATFDLAKSSNIKDLCLIFFDDEDISKASIGDPRLNLSNFQESELQRILATYLLPKRLTGVTTLLEKGSIIYGEKIQSPNKVGECIDKLCAHIQKINGFKLSKRILEFRQTLLAPILISLDQMKKDGLNYTEFQVGANANKLIANLRFPISTSNIESALSEIVNSKNVHWQQIRESADLKIAIYHSQYREIEIYLAWYSSEPSEKKHSFLWKESSRSKRKEELTKAISEYQFQIIHDIRIQEDSESFDLQLSKEAVDISALPEKVVLLLERLNSEKIKLESEIERTKEEDKGAKRKIAQLQKLCGEKEILANNAIKNTEIQVKNYKMTILELESQIESLRNQNKTIQHSQNDTAAEKNSKSEATHKLEQSIRSLENEKAQTNEKYSNEQKKHSLLEQKYNNLFKDSMKKDKEILELKAELIKIKKEMEHKSNQDSEGKASTGATEQATALKIKDLMASEAKLKQEIKKSLFKIESQEKNTKAQQQEFADKLKLMEQKLQTAKTKEVELLKKIEELSSSLKKASKAA